MLKKSLHGLFQLAKQKRGFCFAPFFKHFGCLKNVWCFHAPLYQAAENSFFSSLIDSTEIMAGFCTAADYP